MPFSTFTLSPPPTQTVSVAQRAPSRCLGQAPTTPKQVLRVVAATTTPSTTTADTQTTGCSVASVFATLSVTASTGSASRRRAEQPKLSSQRTIYQPTIYSMLRTRYKDRHARARTRVQASINHPTPPFSQNPNRSNDPLVFSDERGRGKIYTAHLRFSRAGESPSSRIQLAAGSEPLDQAGSLSIPSIFHTLRER